MNQQRRIEKTKEKNDVITLKSEIEMQYNVAKMIKSQNEIQSKIAQLTKDNTKLKVYIKKK